MSITRALLAPELKSSPAARSMSQAILDLIRSTGGGASASGVNVTPETAMRCATVFACVRVLAESVGQLPLIVYRRQKGGGKTRASGHPLYPLLHDAPNEYQTSLEFREMMMGHLALRGNAYAIVTRSTAGEVLGLYPMHPDSVEVNQLSDWSLAYTVRRASGGGTDTYPQREVLHLKGMTADGIMGLSPIAYAREAIGLAIATEQHGSRLFRNGARPGGVLKHPGKLSEEASKRLVASWQEAHTGENAFKAALLEEGMDWTQLGMTSEDSQFLETRKFQRSEIAGLFRVPAHKINDLDRATFTNIEHQGLEFVTDTLLPWLRRWEQAIQRLFTPVDRPWCYAEFLVDGLLRGDMASRYAAYATGIQNGILSPDEVRDRENMNPRTDGLGGEYWIPANMARANDGSGTAAPQ